MATIRTAIQMVDGMSPTIRGMTNALNIVISSFEQMQRASNNSVDTSSIQAARRELAGAEVSLNQMESSIRNSNSQQQQFNNTLQQGQSHADGLASKVGNIVKAYLGFQTVKGIADASDSYVLTQARIGLMNDGLQTTDQLNDKIFQSAERSRSSYIETAKSVAKLGILAKDAFSSNDEMVAFAEQMNKQFKIGRASIEEQKYGMYQLTQAMAAGKLQGDEFRSISENAPLLSQAIAEFTGKSMGELKQMSSEGQITASIIKQSLFAAADEANARFEKLPKTIGDVGTKIKNNAMKIFEPILTRINDIVNYNFDSIVGDILGVMSTIANVAIDIINIGVSIGTFFQNNWSAIQPIVWGVVGAIGAYLVSMALAKTVTLGLAIAEGLKTTAMLISAIATGTYTTAQWGLNAAMYACPIFWILAAILGLIVAFYMAVAAINKVAGTSISATGIIAGAFMAVGAIVYNVVASIWNTFAAFYEFFENVGLDKTYAIKKLFVNLATNVIDSAISMTKGIDAFATNMANAIVDGVNFAIRAWNSFIDLLEGTSIAEKLGLSKGSEFEHTASITSDMENLKSNLEASVANAPDGYKTVQRMEYKDPVDEFKKYYAWGSNVSNIFDNFKLPGDDGKDPTNYDDLLRDAKDTADNTGKMKDKMDITDEDLKYLRDMAEQEVINRFTTAEVKVDMVNHNSISNDMDLDGIIDHLGSGLSESLQTVAEGATYDV